MSNKLKDKNWGSKAYLLRPEKWEKTYEGSYNFLLTKVHIWDDETIQKFMYNLSFSSKNILKSQNTSLWHFGVECFDFFHFKTSIHLAKCTTF